MKPGEYFLESEDIVANEGRETVSLSVTNTGDRPIQVGSHYHFFEVNRKLVFEREGTLGMRLNIASGTAVRFEPGQTHKVELVAYAGDRTIYGFNRLVEGKLDAEKTAAIGRMKAFEKQ